MNGKLCWGLAVLALTGATLNAADPGVAVIRGQNPDAPPQAAVPMTGESYGPLIGSAPGYGEFSKSRKKDFKTFPQFHDNNFGYEGGYYSGPEGYYSTRHNKAYTTGHSGDGCPACQYGNACPSSGCKRCGCKSHPKHYTTYEHKWPENLVYPQYGAPAGMVQYPYYTFRGPTDFFMK
ncbi:MAG: hypothetical protein SFV23_10345 [Planctomycetaceae bacterium]|nr:hypothetical protein [Planctomycetaceae bacterium]